MSIDPHEARGATGEHTPAAEDVIEGATPEERSPAHLIEKYPPAGRRVDTAFALGVFSIGLGVAALLAPRSLGRLVGLQGRTGLLRVVGLREIASGAGLLSQRRRAPWLWSRVGGDAMDLALLGTALHPLNPGRHRALAAMTAVGAVTAVDVTASLRESRRSRRESTRWQEPFIEHTVSIGKSPQECYAFWRDVSNVPKFSPMVQSVTVLDERRSHWVVSGPGGARLEWDSEITVDKAGEKIAWHSVKGSEISHAGVVRFDKAPGGRGTVVRVMMHYLPPAGRAGAAFAKLFGRNPSVRLREDLRRFKSLLETGEIPTTRGQPSGRRSLVGRAAQYARAGGTLPQTGASA